MVQKFEIFILSWNLMPGLLRICKIWWWYLLFFVLDLFCKFYQEIYWHFDVAWLISQQFTRRDLKPVAFLVLPYKAVVHAFFSFFYLTPLVIALFIKLFFSNISTFSVLFFFLNRQTSNFHTLNIWTDSTRTVTVQKYTTGSHN